MVASSQDVQTTVFVSLALLGFDAAAASEKHGTTFHKGMFRRGNVRGMEVIMHFLLCRLDADGYGKKFRHVYPCGDKSQARDFKRLVYAELMALEKAGDLPAGTVRASDLQTCAGERFITLLWHVSTHVLRSVMERECPDMLDELPVSATITAAAVRSGQAAAMINAARMHVCLLAERFHKSVRSGVEEKLQWERFASKLMQQEDELQQQLASAKNNIHPRVAAVLGEKRALERVPTMTRVRSLWKRLETHANTLDLGRGVCEDVLSGYTNRTRVTAADVAFTAPPRSSFVDGIVPDVAVHADDGRVDVAAMVRLWAQTLRAFHGVVDSVQSPTAESASYASATLAKLHEHIAQHESQLASARRLATRLDDHVPDLQQRVASLAERVRQADESLGEAIARLRIGLVPPTPAASFQPQAPPDGVKAKLFATPAPPRRTASKPEYDVVIEDDSASQPPEPQTASLPRRHLRFSDVATSPSPEMSPKTTLTGVSALQIPGRNSLQVLRSPSSPGLAKSPITASGVSQQAWISSPRPAEHLRLFSPAFPAAAEPASSPSSPIATESQTQGATAAAPVAANATVKTTPAAMEALADATAQGMLLASPGSVPDVMAMLSRDTGFVTRRELPRTPVSAPPMASPLPSVPGAVEPDIQAVEMEPIAAPTSPGDVSPVRRVPPPSSHIGQDVMSPGTGISSPVASPVASFGAGPAALAHCLHPAAESVADAATVPPPSQHTPMSPPRPQRHHASTNAPSLVSPPPLWSHADESDDEVVFKLKPVPANVQVARIATSPDLPDSPDHGDGDAQARSAGPGTPSLLQFQQSSLEDSPLVKWSGRSGTSDA